MVSNAITDYVIGKYGRPPVQIEESIKTIILKDEKNKVHDIKSRPADELEPEMKKAKEELSDITSNIDDILIYALYPTTGLGFLRRKYGLEAMPVESIEPVEPKSISEEQPSGQNSITKTGNLKAFNVYLDNEVFYVEVDPINLKQTLVQTSNEQHSSKGIDTPVKDNQIVISAPINGIIIKHLVAEGDQVSTGQNIIILEAMKMENTLSSPTSGIIKKMAYAVGIKVNKGAILAIIEPNS
jgi:biotin carboxyl carrier protein